MPYEVNSEGSTRFSKVCYSSPYSICPQWDRLQCVNGFPVTRDTEEV